MWLNRLDDRPQGNSQTIAPDYFPSGDRSSCDGKFFLKVNSYKLSQCDNAQKPSWQFNSFRKYMGTATAFVKCRLASSVISRACPDCGAELFFAP